MSKAVPKLRFKVFSDKWKLTKIGQVLTIGSGRDYKHLNEGDIPVYGTGGIMTMVNDSLYDGDTVCIGRKGTIDKPMFHQGKIWTVDTLFYTHSFINTKPRFVYNLFERISWKLYNEASGVPSLSKATIEKIHIAIPTLPEQQKIASFLSAVDEKIQRLTRKKELLEQYKKGVMQQLFCLHYDSSDSGDDDDGTSNQGKKKNHSKSQFRQLRFKDENGKAYPKWEEKRLGDVTKLQGGFAFRSELFRQNGIPVIRISNISNNNNFIELNNVVYYDEIPNSDNFTIKNGDLILAMSGATTGKSSIYNLPYNAYLNQRVGLFKSRTETLVYEFLIQFVFSENFQKQLDSVLVAGAQPNVSSSDIESFSFKLPCHEEQQKIASFLSAIDTKKENVATQIEKTKTFKKGLLQQMFV
jgi:type I restriction enzyme S subunit